MPTGKARTCLLSPLAERDLESIWVYTARTWSPEQADRYYHGIMAAMEALASGRPIGRDASDIRAGYRRCKVGRHVLFYREHTDHIAVIRILHQRMDLPAQLGTDD